MREGPERRAATLAAEGIDAVNLHHSDWSGGLTTLFHRFERVCFGWDMQFEHVMRPALRMGIDGIFSDHVDVMVDAFTAELGRGLNRRSAYNHCQSARGQNTTNALPTRSSSAIGPRARLSCEPPRLSPITKTCSSGTVTGASSPPQLPGVTTSGSRYGS